MKKFIKFLTLLLLTIFSFSCSYMKTDLGDDDIEVKIISVYKGKSKIGLKLSFSKIVAALNIPDDINGDKIVKLSFEDATGMSKLKSITIPSTVTEIDTLAGSSITEIALPDGLTVLPSFKSCSSLTSVTVPSGVKEIPDACFTGCSVIEEITFQTETPPELANDKTSPFPVNSKIPLNITVPTGSEQTYWDKWTVVDWKSIKINGTLQTDESTDSEETE